MDQGIRCINEKNNFKLFFVDLTESIIEIIELQKIDVISSLILTRFTLNNVLLASDLKNGELLSSTILNEDGFIKKIVSEFQNNCIRSCIWGSDFFQKNNLDIENILKNQSSVLITGKKSELIVVRNLMNFQSYTSSIQTLNQDVDLIFQQYLMMSQQSRGVLITAVEFSETYKLKKAIGIRIELLPNYNEENVKFLSEINTNLKYYKRLFLTTSNYEKCLLNSFPNLSIIGKEKFKFKCTCSYDKIWKYLKLLSDYELKEYISKEKNIEIICDFCKNEYLFDSKIIQ